MLIVTTYYLLYNIIIHSTIRQTKQIPFCKQIRKNVKLRNHQLSICKFRHSQNSFFLPIILDNSLHRKGTIYQTELSRTVGGMRYRSLDNVGSMEGINSRRLDELGEKIRFHWKKNIKGLSFKFLSLSWKFNYCIKDYATLVVMPIEHSTQCFEDLKFSSYVVLKFARITKVNVTGFIFSK